MVHDGESKKPDPNYGAFARVQVLVEIETGPYGSEWNLDAVHKDAEQIALDRLRHSSPGPLRIVEVQGVRQVIVKRNT